MHWRHHGYPGVANTGTGDEAASSMLYYRFVSQGSYLIVEDSEINGAIPSIRTRARIGSGGPYEAIAEFLASHREFEADVLRALPGHILPKWVLRRKS